MIPAQIPDDETIQALMGLHPHQIAIASALANGNGPMRPPGDSTQPARVISAPSGGARGINVPPVEGSTEDLEDRSAAPKPQPEAVPSQQDTDQAEFDRLKNSPSGIGGFQERHPVLGGIAHGLVGVASSLAPGIAANIPGTDQHHEQLLHQAAGRVEQDVGQQKEEADTAATQAKTDALLHPEMKPKEEEWSAIAGVKGPNGEVLQQEKNSGQVRWATGITGAEPLKEPAEKSVKTDKVTRVVGGVPHTVLINAETGEDVKDEGQTKIPGESAETKRSATESAQVEREARQSIRKAEATYHDTEKSVSQLKASIDAAKDGNGLLTSFVPTMEVLGINAAQGVHRISPAEAQAANMPGSVAERFNAFFDKAATGQLSPELQQEGKALADILLKTSHQRYKSTYEDESQMVEGYGGKGFSTRVKAIPEPVTGEQGGGTVTMKAPDGTTRPVPADQVEHYKSKGAVIVQ